MKSVARVIAEGSGQGEFLASGCYGRVYHHGPNRVYKEAHYDGTGVWLERCFAIQKRLGIDHPLCEAMPEVFSFRRTNHDRYEVVMRKYVRIKERETVDGQTYDTIPAWEPHLESLVDDVIGDGNANDLHTGNILWCRKDKRWVVVDPSFSVAAKCGPQDPKFNRAKRVVTQYGPTRRQ